MKNALLSLILLTTCSLAFAQFQVGLKGGVNFSTVNIKLNGEAASTQPTSVTGFNIGALALIKIKNSIFVQPGVFFTSKGLHLKQQATNFVSDYKLTPLYIEIPLNLLAEFNATGGKFYVGGGPYAAFGSSGKSEYYEASVAGSTTTSIDYHEDISYGNDGGLNDLKAYDYGLNFTALYQLKKGINMGVGYGLSLSNSYPDESIIFTNKVFTISLGYMLKLHK